MKKPFCLLLKILGISLIIGSICIVAFCYFYLQPRWDHFNPYLIDRYSSAAYWQAKQQNIRKFGWSHEDAAPVGMFGGKEWVAWIMNQAEQGQPIEHLSCGDGHKEMALGRMTNQDPFADKNGTNNMDLEFHQDISRVWLEWWKTNQNKTQVQWILDGFAKYNVKVQAPAVRDDWEPLLRLLGNTSTNRETSVPEHVAFNAIRWLRDSGFQAMPYAVSNLTSSTSSEIRNGLMRYEQYLTNQERLQRITPLPFGSREKKESAQPLYVMREFNGRLYYGGALALLLAGIGILRFLPRIRIIDQ